MFPAVATHPCAACHAVVPARRDEGGSGRVCDLPPVVRGQSFQVTGNSLWVVLDKTGIVGYIGVGDLGVV